MSTVAAIHDVGVFSVEKLHTYKCIYINYETIFENWSSEYQNVSTSRLAGATCLDRQSLELFTFYRAGKLFVKEFPFRPTKVIEFLSTIWETLECREKKPWTDHPDVKLPDQ